MSDSGKILFIDIEAHCILIVHIKLDICISFIIIAVIITTVGEVGGGLYMQVPKVYHKNSRVFD